MGHCVEEIFAGCAPESLYGMYRLDSCMEVSDHSSFKVRDIVGTYEYC